MQFELINPVNEKYSPLEQVLTNRGIDYNDITHYLNVTEKDNLAPTLLKNIDEAIKILIKHLLNDSGEILLIVDCDADGYLSSAIMLNYIYKAFPSAVNKFKYVLHDNKQHGIILDEVNEQTSLVLAIDASSNEYEIHKSLYDKGIDVVVIDHHHAEKESEYAIIVNNQLCNYPNKTLCGGGMVYKVCQRIDMILDESYANDFLDLVAVSLIADMMDIRTMETHYLIQQGMKNFRNPFLKAMAEKNSYSLGKELTPIGIAFYIAPFINAMTRSGTMEEKLVLFESMLDWKGYSMVPSTKRGAKGQEEMLVEQAVRTCTNVKNRQTKNRDVNTEDLEAIIKQQNLLDKNKLLLIKAEGIDLNRNIAGLIANETMSRYRRPTAILSPVQKEDGLYWEGSARGVSQSRLNDFRGFCKSSELVNYAEGHNQAFGLSIKDENFDKFLQWSEQALDNIEFSPNYKVDFIYGQHNVSTKTILELGDNKQLYGQKLPEPLIAVKNVAVTKDMITLMSRDKNPTLKIQLSNGVTCIKFKSSEEEFESLLSENGCVNVNLIATPEVNRYFNSVSPQLIIKDYEVINRQEYYF